MTSPDKENTRRRVAPVNPPFIPGHLGAPSYDECARMAVLIGLFEVVGEPMPARLAWSVGQWERPVREWARKEVERGNLDKLMAAASRKAASCGHRWKLIGTAPDGRHEACALCAQSRVVPLSTNEAHE